MDMDLALRDDEPARPADASATQRSKYEKWKKANRVALMIIKRSMNDAVRGGVPDLKDANILWHGKLFWMLDLYCGRGIDVLSDNTVDNITAIRLPLCLIQDSLIWGPSRNEKSSIKSAYQLQVKDASPQHQVSLLKKKWKHQFN